MIEVASQVDHKAIVHLARQEKCTRDFSNMIFSGPEMYENGWIRIARSKGAEHIIGFSCVRHKVREPETSLYFIGVDRMYRRQQVGTLLMNDVVDYSPHNRIVLSCMKDNDVALEFYKRHGFTVVGDALDGFGFKLVKEW